MLGEFALRICVQSPHFALINTKGFLQKGKTHFLFTCTCILHVSVQCFFFLHVMLVMEMILFVFLFHGLC